MGWLFARPAWSSRGVCRTSRAGHSALIGSQWRGAGVRSRIHVTSCRLPSVQHNWAGFCPTPEFAAAFVVMRSPEAPPSGPLGRGGGEVKKKKYEDMLGRRGGFRGLPRRTENYSKRSTPYVHLFCFAATIVKINFPPALHPIHRSENSVSSQQKTQLLVPIPLAIPTPSRCRLPF